MVEFKDVTDFLGFTNSRKKNPSPPVGAVFGNKEALQDEGKRDEFIVKKKEVLHEWDTVSRAKMSPMASVKQNRALIVIGVVVALFFILIQEFLLITVVAALIFLKYVLSTSEGDQVHHKILNVGVEYNGELYTWPELKLFFFFKDEEGLKLCVDTVERFPSRLFFLIPEQDKEKIKEIMETYLPYLKDKPEDFTDKFYNYVSKKIDLNKKNPEE